MEFFSLWRRLKIWQTRLGGKVGLAGVVLACFNMSNLYFQDEASSIGVPTIMRRYSKNHSAS